MIFLGDPGVDRGRRAATSPAGSLLWGPPGTGPRLLAQAVAGETAKPFVAVDPGAFINMFMGVRDLEGEGAVPEAPTARAPAGGRDRGVLQARPTRSAAGNLRHGDLPARGRSPGAAFCNRAAYLAPSSLRALAEFASADIGDRPGVRTDRIVMGAGMGGGRYGHAPGDPVGDVGTVPSRAAW